MKIRNILILVFTALLLGSCNRNQVTVTDFEPQGEVQDLQSFTINFDQELAPADKQDEWLTDEFVTFKPNIPGRFKWLNARTLLFSPETPLKSSQDYSAKVNKAVLFDKKFDLKTSQYSFHTPYFSAVEAEIYWEHIPRTDHKVRVMANLLFNYDVAPGTLSSALRATRDGQSLSSLGVTNDKPSTRLTVNLGEVQQTDQSQKFELTLAKGLLSTNSDRGLPSDKTFTLALAPITKLEIVGATSSFSDDNAWVELLTSQEVDDKNLSSYIEVDPKVNGMRFVTNQNRIRIEGDFKPGSTYEVKVKTGLPGLFGGSLEEAFEQEVVVANLEPSLDFSDKGMYLARGGLHNLAYEGVNIDKAQLRVHEVFKNNLLFFFYQNYDYNNQYYDNGYDYNDGYYVSYYGQQLYEEEITFEATPNLRQRKTLNLDRVLDARFKGIYIAEVRSDQDYWLRDSKLICISDIGLITKKAGNEVLIFANSIKTAEPMANVTINVISTNNQTLFSAKTGPDGVVKFSNTYASMEEEGFYPALITAEFGDDFNFLDVRSARVETSRYDVGGKSIPQSGYDCFIYGDRNLYRPGDKAHITAIMRTASLETVKDIPISLKVFNPRGELFQSFTKELDDQGALEVTLDIPDFAQTGRYRVELMTGDEQFIQDYVISVEEFVPDKIRVAAKGNKDKFQLGEKLSVDIDAEYLFGAPAANHKYEMDVRLRHATFQSEQFKGYNFYAGRTNQNQLQTLNNEFFEGKLDEKGEVTQTYDVPASIETPGYIKGTANASVFDLTGRTVSQGVDFNIYPNTYYVGLKTEGYYYRGVNQDISFSVVAVDKDDQAAKGATVELTLIRKVWKTVLVKSNRTGRYRYHSEMTTVKEWDRTVTINGKAEKINFQVDKSGSYELYANVKGNQFHVTQNFYAYYRGRSGKGSFEIDKEGRVDIVLDKEKYAPGEKAHVLFVTPFAGKMLVTVERDNILDYQYVNVTGNSVELDIDLGPEHLPNAYITATLFRPHTADNQSPFMVGHGFSPVMVEDANKHLAVEIKAPTGTVKPRTTQKITVKTNPEQDIRVTIAAVDEGILQIKGYKSPDPYSAMYAKRSLQVESYDLYEYLLPEIVAPKMSSPAGGDEGRSKRLNPVKAKRFKLLSYWSGIKRTNAKGEVTIDFEIPQFNGEVRIMAVAYKGDRFGSADQPMKVADEIVLQPSIPRVLSVGDTLVMPVSVMNTTNQAGSATVKLGVEGPIELISDRSRAVQVGALGTETTYFTLVGKSEVGTAKITLTTSGMDKVTEEIEIAVRPISPYIRKGDGGSINAGEEISFSIPDNFVKGTQEASVSVSSFPATGMGRHFRYLLRYPYGCLEQTTSAAFPQLYFNELAQQIAPEMYKNGNPLYFAQQGMVRIQDMMRYDGSFSYWPQYDGPVNWWSSVFATHYLVEAKKKGFEVNEQVLDKSLDYLVRRTADRETYTYYTYDGGRRISRTIAEKSAIYSLYVLALAGRPEISFMNYYRARPQLLSGDSRYLLAGAYALAKDWPAFNDLVPSSYATERTDRLTGGSFDSEIRANAIMLNVLLDVNPDHPQVPLILDYLSKNIDKAWSTQDRVWTFLAMGKAAKRASESDVKVEMVVDGKVVNTFGKGTSNFSANDFLGKKVTLRASGKGNTYFGWDTEGIQVNGKITEEDNNMKVRRNYFDRFGAPITDNKFKQGDLVVCQIALTGGPRTVDNVAISDLIPAGFEIENPRLRTSADLEWVDKKLTKLYPQYVDIRDDRILLFTSAAPNKTYYYYYMMRVVNTGNYRLAPIGAEAMYDPNYRSYHGAGLVKVTE
jgi:uncharacterized protein YfaS (alpha-2-macroglobulin family)